MIQFCCFVSRFCRCPSQDLRERQRAGGDQRVQVLQLRSGRSESRKYAVRALSGFFVSMRVCVSLRCADTSMCLMNTSICNDETLVYS